MAPFPSSSLGISTRIRRIKYSAGYYWVWVDRNTKCKKSHEDPNQKCHSQTTCGLGAPISMIVPWRGALSLIMCKLFCNLSLGASSATPPTSTICGFWSTPPWECERQIAISSPSYFANTWFNRKRQPTISTGVVPPSSSKSPPVQSVDTKHSARPLVNI